ncbi:PP2C-domain-containing protein [Microstroma glucosiphilum]|uniref:PP2C-domain-containing protein n=1 Tax=Pseudomicrostroma glucosiphilum TaxID=1684307 RepID=A0A316U4A4_9BASI|nr:PP2C-domain-containing protein [Pseudomicrostroma glucosiphilum]PWN19193.1 PP2C-domain-containing protein [Pseudomicrostroma glucosiphilum]
MGGLRTALDGSGNAKSKAESTAEGSNTHGVVNRHPAADHAQQTNETATTSSSEAKDPASTTKALWPFKVGVSEDRNRRWRRTMEDAHAFVYDFGGVHGQGYFSVFDGHAGKQSAEWCGKHFHEYLVDALATSSQDGKSAPVPDVLNTTFHNVDARLYELANEEKTSSGCTAVTCFLRLEDEAGKPLAFASTGGVHPVAARRLSGIGGAASAQDQTPNEAGSSPSTGGTASLPSSESGGGGTSDKGGNGGSMFKSFARRMRGTSSGAEVEEEEEQPPAKGESSSNVEPGSDAIAGPDGLVQISGAKVRRVLYTANVGDARAVLCRRGQAVRLTYDHKASDAQEAKRITDAGGFVMNNRVNAVLAVTRSLGDSAMKEFVVGAPYTTETTLTDDDTFLIVACDGLWDVVDDQDAVDLVKDVQDPIEMSQRLLQHALSNFSTDNTSVMVVRFRVDASGFPSTAAPRTGSSTGDGSSATSVSGGLAKQGDMTGFATTESPEMETSNSGITTSISQRQQEAAQEQSDRSKGSAEAD